MVVTCIRCGGPRGNRFKANCLMCHRCSCEHDVEAKAAIRQVHRRIRRGEIEKAAAHLCVDCGKQAFDYDHRDYLKPIDVVPVCRGCNIRRGPALDSRMRSIPAKEAA